MVFVALVYAVGYQDGIEHREPTNCDPSTPELILLGVASVFLRAWEKVV